MCRWSRTCMVICCWFQSCGMCCCEVWPCVVSSAVLLLQKMTDFKEQCICIRLLFQIGKIGAETFQMLTFAFREEAMRQTVEFYCSAESRNGMTSVKDAEYSGCLPTGRRYRKVEHIYGIWHESGCITVHKLANELGSLLVYAIKFWHQIEFVIDCVKISALYADWWAETIGITSVHNRTLRRNVRHSHLFSEAITDDSMGSQCLK